MDLAPSPLAGEGWGEGVKMCDETKACANVSPSPQPSPIKGEGVKAATLRKSCSNQTMRSASTIPPRAASKAKATLPTI